MSKKKRRKFSKEFKAKVALEAIKEQETISQIASRYEVHPNQVTNWKKELLEGAVDVFSGKRETDISEAEKEKLTTPLYEEIGRLKVEADWLRKKLNLFS